MKRETRRVPTGAVHVDRLLRQVLTAAARKYRLSAQEIQQYGLLALARVTAAYPLVTHSADAMWDRLLLHDDRVLLLPDNEASADYARHAAECCFILRDVQNVAALVRRAFIHLLVDEEVRPNAAQRDLLEALADEARPRQRAHADPTDPKFASLGWLTEEAARRHSERRLEQLTALRDRILSRLKPRHAKVVELYMRGHKARAISDIMQFGLAQVHAVLAKFTDAVANEIQHSAEFSPTERAWAAERSVRKKGRKNNS